MLELIFKSRKNKVKFFSYFDCFLPMKKNKVILVVKNKTFFSGNQRIAFEILIEIFFDVYIYKDGKINPFIKEYLISKGAKVIEGYNLISLYHISTTNFLIFGHAVRDAHISKTCKNRIIINLWHGVIFKNIELLIPNNSKEKQDLILKNALLFDAIVASGEIDKMTMSKAFGISDEKVYITGQPRYEILKSTYTIKDPYLLRQVEEFNTIKKRFTKTILYAPTFREFNIQPLKQLNENEFKILNDYLNKNNFLLCIKTHSYDLKIPQFIKNLSNLYIIDNEFYTEVNLILKYIDLLVVDYSSIWIDYLLLNKPIIGFSKDYTTYVNKERGFAYNFNEVFPDIFTHSIEELIKEINNYFIKNKKYNYDSSRKFFHKYTLEADFKKEFSEVIKKLKD